MNHQPVGTLGSKAKGGLLGESVEQQGLRRLPHMEYQKSSAALDLATQLLDGGKCLATNSGVRSWVRMGLEGGWVTISGTPYEEPTHQPHPHPASSAISAKSSNLQLNQPQRSIPNLQAPLVCLSPTFPK